MAKFGMCISTYQRRLLFNLSVSKGLRIRLKLTRIRIRALEKETDPAFRRTGTLDKHPDPDSTERI